MIEIVPGHDEWNCKGHSLPGLRYRFLKRI